MATAGGPDQSEKIPTFVLLGKTGNGKSATGNTILGREVFEESCMSTSETFDVSTAYGRFEERKLKVVDTPGLCETRMSEAEAAKKVIDDMTKTMFHCSGGIDAMLIVLRFGVKFTSEELFVVNALKKMFGQNFLKDYGVIIITYGDNFDTACKKKSIPFSRWISAQEGEFKTLLQECQDRYVLFRNADPDKRYDAVTDLLAKVDKLMSRGVSYTKDIFDKADKERDKFYVQQNAKVLTEKMQLKIDNVQDRLSVLKKKIAEAKDFETLKPSLEKLHDDTVLLEAEIEREDKETGVLQPLMNIMNNLKTSTSCLRESVISKEKKEEVQRSINDVGKELERFRLDNTPEPSTDYLASIGNALSFVGAIALEGTLLTLQLAVEIAKHSNR